MSDYIHTRAALNAVPTGAVVRSSGGTIAARFNQTLGVLFGDERPFPWDKLALPAQLLWAPDETREAEQ